MVSIIQGIMVIGGLILLIGSHVFFKGKPEMEQVVDKIVEQVVQSTTSVNLDLAGQAMDNVVDVIEDKVEQKDNK